MRSKPIGEAPKPQGHRPHKHLTTPNTDEGAIPETSDCL